VRRDPALQILAPGGLGVGVVGAAEDSDEDVGLSQLAGAPIHDCDGGAGEVDEELLARLVNLAEHHIHLAPKAPVALAELGVLQTVGVVGLVFQPQELEGHPGARELPVHLLRIRLGAGRRRESGRWIEKRVKSRLIELLGERKGKSGHL
jgi:hypothetical protein